MRLIISFLLIARCITTAHATNYLPQTGVEDSTGYVPLFDFQERWYGPGSSEVRIKWEEEFIAFAKKTENTPERYIKHMMSWLNLSKNQKSLADYRLDYTFANGMYSLEYYRSTTDDNKYARESLREAYLFSHISRSNENMMRLWEIFGGLVKELASPCLANNRIERSYIQGLIDAWSCITSKRGYEKKLDVCYEKLVTEKPDTYSMINYVDNLMCNDLKSRFGKNDENNYTSNLQWLFTFWVRRHHEGNTAATLVVLNSLLE